MRHDIAFIGDILKNICAIMNINSFPQIVQEHIFKMNDEDWFGLEELYNHWFDEKVIPISSEVIQFTTEFRYF